MITRGRAGFFPLIVLAIGVLCFSHSLVGQAVNGTLRGAVTD